MGDSRAKSRVRAGVLTNEEVMVKNATFYSDRSWNNPALACPKMSEFYHSRKMKLDALAETEKQEKKKEDDEPALRIQAIRIASGGFALARRIAGREALQARSSQKFNASLKKEILDRVASMKPTTGSFELKAAKPALRAKTELMDLEPRNLWNRFSELSAKNVKILLNRSIVRSDEQSFHRLLRAVDQNYQEKILEPHYKAFLRSKVRREPPPSAPLLKESKYDFSSLLHHDEPGLRGNLINDVNRVDCRMAQNVPIVRFVLQHSKLARELAEAKTTHKALNPPSAPPPPPQDKNNHPEQAENNRKNQKIEKNALVHRGDRAAGEKVPRVNVPYLRVSSP